MRVGMSDSLAVEEVVSIVEPSGNCAKCSFDAGAVGSYCSSLYTDESNEV